VRAASAQAIYAVIAKAHVDLDMTPVILTSTPEPAPATVTEDDKALDVTREADTA
jgi:hypothetical protein